MRKLFKLCHNQDGGYVDRETQHRVHKEALKLDVKALLLSDEKMCGVSDYLYTTFAVALKVQALRLVDLRVIL